MDGANTNALEWALALLHTPAERYTLRQKPLPQGIDRLLGIAAGVMPRDQVEAAQAFGVPEARVREAAQFYAREVLFFPQADAYRVLGVNAVASSDQIKAHHRLLQHWLHPDRQRSEDDAIFAARVNSASNTGPAPGLRRIIAIAAIAGGLQRQHPAPWRADLGAGAGIPRGALATSMAIARAERRLPAAGMDDPARPGAQAGGLVSRPFRYIQRVSRHRVSPGTGNRIAATRQQFRTQRASVARGGTEPAFVAGGR